MDGNRRRATCRSLGDGDVGLWVDYEDRLQAKAIPTARWDKHLKCWRIRSVFRDEAEDLVHDLNDRHAGAWGASRRPCRPVQGDDGDVRRPPE